MHKDSAVATFVAVVSGRVQGLGFRPSVYRLAREFGVSGSVRNTGRGVEITAQGKSAAAFLARLRASPPPLARISGFSVRRARLPRCAGFRIITSQGRASSRVDVLPDLAVCGECRAEVTSERDRRAGYPFTNCTQCGPRYTIIEALPYDRPRTTMRGFAMCPACAREYDAPGDRRFHAQPNACHDCGPSLSLLDAQGRAVSDDSRALVERAARAISRGRVVAIKSLGGFQLACDASSDRAVCRLRRRKSRPAKPFALMCESLAVARRFCRVTRTEAKLLASPAAPIVLLAAAGGRRRLSPAVAPGNDRLGVMLCYTPLHLLLFAALRRLTGRPALLVMTSANRRDAPIVAECAPPGAERAARGEGRDGLFARLGGVFDLVLDHDRPIAGPCDDSVVLARPELGPEAAVPIRVARGYAPVALDLAPMFHVKHPVLAVGGDGRNAFCLAERDKAYVSPHIGDMSTDEAERFFLRTLDRLKKLTGIRPRRFACDLHPDYATTRLAERLAGSGPLLRVQHHFAHTVAVMAERSLPGPVLGLALDGTGYGTDGAIWGCEFIRVLPDLSWQRLAHLAYTRLPIAGQGLPDPKRLARAYLSPTGKGVLSSSLGRLFDAAAAMTGVCVRATFDGQPAMALEAAAGEAESYHKGTEPRGNAPPGAVRLPPRAMRRDAGTGMLTIPPLPFLHLVAEARARGASAREAARLFHLALGRALGQTAVRLCREHRLTAVALSGGSAQNRLLTRAIVRCLKPCGIKLYTTERLPANDASVCLGQAVASGR